MIRRARTRAVGIAVAAVVILGAAGACAGDEPGPGGAPAPPGTDPGRTVWVLLGGDQSEAPPGVGSLTRAWEQLVYASLPPASVLTDLADRRPTAQSVIREQLPRAQSLHPTIATVWLGTADAEANTSVATFSDALEQIITGLQQAGARKVLLLSARATADSPDRLADDAPLPAGGDGAGPTTEPDPSAPPTTVNGERRYDEAMDAVAARTGARVVALRSDRLTQEGVAAAIRPLVAS